MGLPQALTRDDVIEALKWIDSNPNGVPAARRIRKFALRYQGHDYPPKFVISKAYEILTGTKFVAVFSGGAQANNFLIKRKFEVWDVSKKPPQKVGLEAVPQDDEQIFKEGKVLIQYRKHKRFERDSRVSKLAKNQRLAKDEFLLCDACGFSFAKTYGDVGVGFIEAHHKVPLSKLKGEKTIRVSDLALLCANCHRMIHQSNPILTIEQLKAVIFQIAAPTGP